MVASAFYIDVREVMALGRSIGNGAPKIIGDELVTATTDALGYVQLAVNARVKHRSGRYSQSYKRDVTYSGTTVVGTLTNSATSDKGFVYAFTLEYGRGPVTVKNARALRFVVGGQVLFRHSVGPAPAQHPMEYGLNDAVPKIDARYAQARDKIATRIERL